MPTTIDPAAREGLGPANGPTLLVLAAGMGSRFGGLKQMEPLGPGGETVLEYSVYDAVRAGFTKVVFVVRRRFADAFRAQVLARFENQVAVDLAFQELDALPTPFQLPPGREKPWGTAHAVLSARPQVTTPFAVINADDFYGPEAFRQLAAFLSKVRDTWPASFGLVAYRLGNTLSEHGTVSRGVCEIDSRGYLVSVQEREKIEATADGPRALTDEGPVPLGVDTPVSMNMMAFTPAVFPFLEEQFREFLEERGSQPRSEFYLPAAVASIIRRGQCRVTVLDTAGQWLGVTYPEDREGFRTSIARKVEAGEYPSPLWNAMT